MSGMGQALTRCSQWLRANLSGLWLAGLLIVFALSVVALIADQLLPNGGLGLHSVLRTWDGKQGVTLHVRFDDGLSVEGLQVRVENIWHATILMDPDEEPWHDYYDLPADGVLQLRGALNGLRVIFQPNSPLAVPFEFEPGFGEHELVLPSANRVHVAVRVDGGEPEDWLGLPGTPRTGFREWVGSRDQVVPGSYRRYGEVGAGFTASYLGLARQDRLLLVGLGDLEQLFEWFSGVELVPREGQSTPLTLAMLPDPIEFVAPLAVVGRVLFEPGAKSWTARFDVEVDVGGVTYSQQDMRLGRNGELHIPIVHPRFTLARYEGGQAQVDVLFGGMRILVYHPDSSSEVLVTVDHLDVERGANVGVVNLAAR